MPITFLRRVNRASDRLMWNLRLYLRPLYPTPSTLGKPERTYFEAFTLGLLIWPVTQCSK